MLPVKLPTNCPVNCGAYIFAYLFASGSNSPYICCIVNTFLVSMFPIISTLPPTFESPAIPTPPFTIKDPVPKFVLAVVPSIVVGSLTLILPVTSNASLGRRIVNTNISCAINTHHCFSCARIV